jgi:adenylosuccinate lyase
MHGTNITSLDGRYHDRIKNLSPYFSEFALMKYRTMVECEFLICLSESKLTALRQLTPSEVKKLKDLYESFNDASYQKIKDIEAVTNHDVKAVEYYIKESLKSTSLKNTLEWVHFGLTSEDTNNIAYALMLSDSLETVMIPEIKTIVSELSVLAKKYAPLPMLARTHGQSASPTTFGKEMRVFAARLEKRLEGLGAIKIQAKLNGATGNYNAFVAAYPKANWLGFSKKFIESFNKNRKQKLEVNLITTQIECHDSYVAVFDTVRRINTILLDFNQDMWRYISDGYVTQKPKAGEVGSSTMPHKINPIDFENSEGNLGLANALFEFFARKLPVSRLQRDLSDSTVERAFGTAFGHSYLAYIMLEKGLGKISVNEQKIKEDLLAHPEIIAEAIQTILRREGYPIPYEALKELTRGRQITMEDFAVFIDSLKISPKLKSELKKLTPLSYIGIADKIARGL